MFIFKNCLCVMLKIHGGGTVKTVDNICIVIDENIVFYNIS